VRATSHARVGGRVNTHAQGTGPRAGLSEQARVRRHCVHLKVNQQELVLVIAAIIELQAWGGVQG